MLSFVRDALLEERQRQQEDDIHCAAIIDGYTDFIFLNRNGQPQHQGTLNKALRRITRDCNEEQMAQGKKLLLPHFSCALPRQPSGPCSHPELITSEINLSLYHLRIFSGFSPYKYQDISSSTISQTHLLNPYKPFVFAFLSYKI